MDIMQDVELSQILSRIVGETNKGYISFSELKDQLKNDLIHFGLTRASPVEVVKSKVKPFLGDTLIIYSGRSTKNNSSYLVLKNKELEIVTTYIKTHPNKSHLQIKTALPLLQKTTIQILNALIADGTLIVRFNESASEFTPQLSIHESATTGKASKSNQVNIRARSTTSKTAVSPSKKTSSAEFRDAYLQLVRGGRFVKIYEIRRALNWDRDSFDRLIEKLRDDGQIFLQQADLSKMKEDDIKDCFVDENNILMVLVTWEGK